MRLKPADPEFSLGRVPMLQVESSPSAGRKSQTARVKPDIGASSEAVVQAS
jgi:hypothetical protein